MNQRNERTNRRRRIPERRVRGEELLRPTRAEADVDVSATSEGGEEPTE
jgi:hypothetical protein